MGEEERVAKGGGRGEKEKEDMEGEERGGRDEGRRSK